MIESLAVERYYDIEDRIPEFFLELTSLYREKLVNYTIDNLLDLTPEEYNDEPVNAVAELTITVKYYSEELLQWRTKSYRCYLDDCGKRVDEFTNNTEFEQRVDHWLSLFV
jgi:hypothetical protein